VRPVDEAFKGLPAAKADGEMLDLALHIIKKKAGRFDPKKFDDRYDTALLELVKAKMEGCKIEPPKAPETTKASDLMEALRQSAEAGGGTRAAKPKREADKTAGAKLKTAKRRKAA
jgi:DNA end-binding protein Ku